MSRARRCRRDRRTDANRNVVRPGNCGNDVLAAGSQHLADGERRRDDRRAWMAEQRIFVVERIGVRRVRERRRHRIDFSRDAETGRLSVARNARGHARIRFP